MNLKIALLDVPHGDGWQGPSGIFQGAAQALSPSGHQVRVVDVASPHAPNLPVHTGLGRATSSRPMIDSHRAALELAVENPDIIIAPLRGGGAQACLMARACGEAFARTRIVLLANEPSRSRFLDGESTSSDLSPVVTDAMERQSLALADAVIFPGAEADLCRVRDLVDRLPAVISRPIARTTPSAPPSEVEEIVFLGALQRSSGAGEFIEAIERLCRKGTLGDRSITFLGPATDFAYGLSKEWLGLKARNWTFKFRLVPQVDRAQALLYAAGNRRLVVGISSDDQELNAIRNCQTRHVACAGRPMTDPHLATRLTTAIESALHNAPFPGDRYWDIDWLGVIADIVSLPLPPKPASPKTISVCILHFNRLSLLQQAIASIPSRVGDIEPEILIIDNASPIEHIEDKIRGVAGDRTKLRVLALSEPLSPTAAYNQGLAAAFGEIVVFLDDDNLLLPDGLQKFATALQNTHHDLVVSALDMFDDDTGNPGTSIGRMIFLGSAYSAGLFFNAFGDTSMAVRREAFAAHGGFHELGYSYPRFDWVSLAKAQSAGLRIGALQSPAVRYRYSALRTALQADKLDEASARALVFQAYRGCFDAELVSRLAQHLHLSDL